MASGCVYCSPSPVLAWGWSCRAVYTVSHKTFGVAHLLWRSPKLWRESEPLNANLAGPWEALPRCAHWWISSLLTCCRAPRVCMGEGKESEGRRQPPLHTATQGCCWARANHKLAGRRCSARMLKYEQRFDNCAWCMLLASLLMPLHFCIVAAITQVQNNSVKKIQYLMFDRIHASTAFRLLYLLHFYSAQMNF